MRIITLTCSDCGTITAANVLETHREMKCPGLECGRVLRFADLSGDEREHVLENRSRYTME